MFCPKCGQKAEEPNQRFCKNCGSEILTNSEARSKSQSRTAIPMSQQKPVQIGGIGPYSYLCFIFSIISIGLAIINSILSLSILRSLDILFEPPSYYVRSTITIVTITSIVGLTLGILSRVFSQKAGNLEAENTIEKIGSVFSIFGIVFNTIPLGFAVTMSILFYIYAPFY
ncbi:MAG: hypothetical protein ACFFAN_03760 [Promethearchaeota archaeon]